MCYSTVFACHLCGFEHPDRRHECSDYQRHIRFHIPLPPGHTSDRTVNLGHPHHACIPCGSLPPELAQNQPTECKYSTPSPASPFCLPLLTSSSVSLLLHAFLRLTSLTTKSAVFDWPLNPQTQTRIAHSQDAINTPPVSDLRHPPPSVSSPLTYISSSPSTHTSSSSLAHTSPPLLICPCFSPLTHFFYSLLYIMSVS